MPPYPTCNLQIHKIQWIQRCTNNLVNCIDHSPRTVQIWRLEQQRRRQQGMSPKGGNTKAGIHAVPSSLHSLIEAVIVVYASTSARHGSCLNTFAQLEIYESVLWGAKKKHASIRQTSIKMRYYCFGHIPEKKSQILHPPLRVFSLPTSWYHCL